MTTFGTEILQSEFPDDLGAADPALVDAIQKHSIAPGPATMAYVVETLRNARLLIPVVAVVTERAADGSDKQSEIQQVYFTANDGRNATLSFSSIDSLHLWDPAARPIPQWGRLVAASVVELGHDALIIDFASSDRIAIPASALTRLL